MNDGIGGSDGIENVAREFLGRLAASDDVICSDKNTTALSDLIAQWKTPLVDDKKLLSLLTTSKVLGHSPEMTLQSIKNIFGGQTIIWKR